MWKNGRLGETADYRQRQCRSAAFPAVSIGSRICKKTMRMPVASMQATRDGCYTLMPPHLAGFCELPISNSRIAGTFHLTSLTTMIKLLKIPILLRYCRFPNRVKGDEDPSEVRCVIAGS